LNANADFQKFNENKSLDVAQEISEASKDIIEDEDIQSSIVTNQSSFVMDFDSYTEKGLCKKKLVKRKAVKRLNECTV